MTTAATIDPSMLLNVFGRNLTVLAGMMDGIDDHAAGVSLVDGGSNLHWLLGHLVASRDALLERLGAERVWDVDIARDFARGSAGAAPRVATIAEQLTRLRAQQARLETALVGIDRSALDRDAGRMTIGGWIEFMAWHETYHLGQAMLYRRAAGLPSTIG
jgi:uncharacterized damage-inducible protein DinB